MAVITMLLSKSFPECYEVGVSITQCSEWACGYTWLVVFPTLYLKQSSIIGEDCIFQSVFQFPPKFLTFLHKLLWH